MTVAPVLARRAGPPVPSGGTARARDRVHLTVVAVLLVACTVGWRRGQYFAGSLDPVVAVKGLLSVLALAMAFHAAQNSRHRRRLGTGSLWFLAVLRAGSVFGALTSGTLAAGALVAVRVLVLALAVFCALRFATPEDFVDAVARACGAIGLVAAATGLPSLASGRLAGACHR